MRDLSTSMLQQSSRNAICGPIDGRVFPVEDNRTIEVKIVVLRVYNLGFPYRWHSTSLAYICIRWYVICFRLSLHLFTHE